MKSSLIFLILIAFAICEISKEITEEMEKRRREQNKFLAECLLKSDTISEVLRNKLKNGSDDEIRMALLPGNKDFRLEKNEIEALRKCRLDYLDKMRAKHREERERMKQSQNENL